MQYLQSKLDKGERTKIGAKFLIQQKGTSDKIGDQGWGKLKEVAVLKPRFEVVRRNLCGGGLDIGQGTESGYIDISVFAFVLLLFLHYLCYLNLLHINF